MRCPPPRYTLFPYTTLFRSGGTGLVRTNRSDRSRVEVFRLNIFRDEVWVKATVFLIRDDQRITEFTCNRSQEGIVGVSFNQRGISHLADIANLKAQGGNVCQIADSELCVAINTE